MESRWSLGELRLVVWFLFFLSFGSSIAISQLPPGAFILENEAQPFQRLFAGIASTCVFLLLTDTVWAMVALFSNKRFRNLFGAEMHLKNFKLVYPDFVLSPEVRTRIADLDEQFVYIKESTEFAKRHYVDLPRAVAANDIQGAVLISGLFGELLMRSPDLVRDADVIRDSQISFVSFGLTSNDCTFMYLQRDVDPMFLVIEESEGSQYLRVADGKQNHEFKSAPTFQYGIIVRYCPDRDHAKRRVWIFCAGLGPTGTPAAAWYLRQNWKVLDQQTRGCDFVAVVRTRHYSFTEAEIVLLVARRGRKRRRIRIV